MERTLDSGPLATQSLEAYETSSKPSQGPEILFGILWQSTVGTVGGDESG